MDRPGVDFELYNAGSILPDSQIPEGKTVVVQILGVQLDKTSDNDFVGSDWVVSFK
jgi:hypothetical protein